MLLYEVLGKPIPWQVPRLNKKSGHVYNPRSLEKARVTWQLRAQCSHPPLRCPVYLGVTFIMPIPQSIKGLKRQQMLHGALWPICKPDRSNMLKFIEDCMQDAGILANDSVIVDGPTRKIYGIEPKTIIRVKTMEEFRQMLEVE